MLTPPPFPPFPPPPSFIVLEQSLKFQQAEVTPLANGILMVNMRTSCTYNVRRQTLPCVPLLIKGG